MQPTEPVASQISGAPPDDSEVTVVSKKPPQQFCGSGVDWRKVGELLLGRQLGTFRLDRLLGTGGMGAVFQATDLQLDRQVAVKVLQNAEDDPEAARRFRIEAQSAAKLDHQNIARVFHVGQDQGWNYIVLELVEGLTLRQWVAAKGPLDLKLAVHLFRQLASALDHAHQRNIIHRDIKPSNVLVTEDLNVKIVDMGLARIQKSRDAGDHESEEGLTLGTFDYIAPEQARDPRQADQQSDLYSLGCTLYFALVGRPPFADSTSFEKILSHSSSPRPAVLATRGDLPPEVDSLVARLMAPRKEERYQSARELLRDLPQLLVVKRKALPAPPRPWGRESSATRLPLMVLAATGLWVAVSLVWDANWGETTVRLPDWPREPQWTANVEPTSAAAPTTTTEVVSESPRGTGGEREPLVGSVPGETLAEGPTARVDGGLPDRSLERPGASGGASGGGAGDGRLVAMGGALEGFKLETPSLFSRYLFAAADGEAPRRDAQLWPGQETGAANPNSFDFPLSPDLLRPKIPAAPTMDGAAPRLESQWLANQVTTLRVIPPTDAAAAEEGLAVSGSGESPTRTRANVHSVASLEQAILYLDRYPNVQTIELHFDGPHPVSHLRIPPGALREIEAGPGYRPLLQFLARDPLVEAPGVLIESGSLEISGIDFVWETAGENYASGVACLFGVPTLGRLVFRHCSFTQLPEAGRVSGTGASDTQAWFYLNQVPVSPLDGQPAGLFSLSHCSFRGAAGVVHSRFAHPARLRLTHCLAVAESSLFVWGGRVGAGPVPGVELELEHCSLFGKSDLIRVRDSVGRPAVPIHVFAQNCVLLAAGEAAAVVNHLREATTPGLAEEGGEIPIDFVGFNNAYFAANVLTQTDSTGRRLREFDLPSAQQAAWFQDEVAVDGAASATSRQDWVAMFNLPVPQIQGRTLVGLLGNDFQSHGVDWQKLPVFPNVPTPAAAWNRQ